MFPDAGCGGFHRQSSALRLQWLWVCVSSRLHYQSSSKVHLHHWLHLKNQALNLIKTWNKNVVFLITYERNVSNSFLLKLENSCNDYSPVILRFAALTRNIRYRRGGKVDIKMPLFRDLKTPEFLRLDSQKNTANPSLPYSVAAASLLGKSEAQPEMWVSLTVITYCSVQTLSHLHLPCVISSPYFSSSILRYFSISTLWNFFRRIPYAFFFSSILWNFFIIYFLMHCSPMEVDTDIHMDAMAFGMGMCCLVSEGHYLAISKWHYVV